jgi:hypothetical protein
LKGIVVAALDRNFGAAAESGTGEISELISALKAILVVRVF